ncbi:carboxy terminal-processing peptidase [Candidatus Uabimicrobium amorphum]|uniref:Peptidase S41 n=1 Tax=Uabimicrobium amorphum TaxID=2596890 RepID=A0A5S9F3N9_UABAM|nr:carboxy terminal-processing peptidase [Candidatus Uabimicrobium amorphum]BBM84935.1 peptidase S41 [Candidatus Uabimicrobium amorphum]
MDNRKKNIKIFTGITTGVVVLVTLIVAFVLPTTAEEKRGKHEPVPEGSYIATTIISILENYHYSKPQINDDVSKSLFDEYIKKLDPNKLYFTADDIKIFSEYKTSLDDQLKTGNTDFAFVVYRRFLQRLEERNDYVKKNINNKFDFSKDETFVVKREGVSWAKDKNELDEIWRKHIKNQLLQAKLQEMQQQKDNEKKKANKKDSKQDENTDPQNSNREVADEKDNREVADEKDNREVADEKDSKKDWKQTAEERIIKRYKNYHTFMSGNDGYYILEAYLTSLTSLFDPHSNYLNWRTLSNFQISLSLSLQGIGAVISSENGYPKISSVVPGGPADRQGELKAGYYIVSVTQENGEQTSVIDMPLNQVVQKIRGEKGTKVTLTVLKNLQDVPFNIVITRDEVKLTERAAKGDTREITLNGGEKKNIGVITLPSFYRDFDAFEREDPNAKSTTRDVKRIIEDMQKKNVEGLVIDLRSNGGGSLDEVVDLVGLFIPQGAVVQVKNLSGEIKVREDNDDNFAYKMPLVVITDTFSASASEIFAGAIQDYKRGIIVGNNTYGKGTVQSLFGLGRKPKAGALKYTISKFYRPTGASTQQKGVAPDITYPTFVDQNKYGESSLPHVMPWDTIKSLSPNQEVFNAHKSLAQIKKQARERMDNDAKFQTLKSYIAKVRERQQDNAVSLNLEKRRTMQEQEQKWYEQIEKILGQQEEEDAVKKDEDLFLEESVSVLRDLMQAK